MSFNSKNVFLVCGQRLSTPKTGLPKLLPESEKRIIVALNDVEAYALLATEDAGFLPTGYASLYDYEQAVVNIRSSLSGEAPSWPVFVAPGMASS